MLDPRSFTRSAVAGWQHGFDLTVAASATTSSSACIVGMSTFALSCPSLDSGTIRFQGQCSTADSWRTLVDDAGAAVQVAATTGGSTIASSSSPMLALTGLYGVRLVLGAAQTSASRAFVLAGQG